MTKIFHSYVSLMVTAIMNSTQLTDELTAFHIFRQVKTNPLRRSSTSTAILKRLNKTSNFASVPSGKKKT